MRKSLFLYLFVFAALLAIFQYVNARRMLESKNEDIEALENELASTQQQNDSLASENSSLNYFTLDSNEEAISYFEEQGLDAAEVANQIENQIISQNKADADNPLVPYEGMEGKMRVNKIKILNHKWILADFTDGTYWGEMFISYYIDENNNLILETENSFLYPRD
ncbi:MAG TPA: hypothetical protein VFM59_08210 [Salinimicrobium sp.]|nr:hypothetical protein [Salinimicrobium sp.]